ncbi:membrane protein [Dermacoccus sp. PE3]|uniref:DUF4126 domain-containing protein n=1 Tax=unclassified Dermacoccus TaxID=2643059 RepID=UPI000641C123|nr:MULTISPECIES: DUF4126 domain-containing protein [unclassified Dermacoccus]KLO62084.1 membrane protein [Dermacoccus sp. PE3]QNK53942.1 DUF4126 domain-containing protein [Dermacoccus sp. PAMC28757]
MFAALTGAGLSAAAGLNAYIPFLLVALLARFTDVVNLPAGFEWVESTWAIVIGAVLLIGEVVVDKIPALDSVNDALGTVVRPASGAVVFAATAAAADLDSSAWMTDHPWAGLIGGAIVAGIFHTGKAAARPVANAGTAGFAAPVLSTAEDAAAVTLSLAAVFAPVLALVLLLLVAWMLWRAWRSVVRMRERRADRRRAAGVV